MPLWSIGTVFALVALLAYLGPNSYLRDSTLHTLAPYSQIIKLGPQSANLTISLP
ncbi:type VI protein secretion system component VasF [Paraburkholderia sp. EB58]